jgi:TM2 domain-containing membrane protein YozV
MANQQGETQNNDEYQTPEGNVESQVSESNGEYQAPESNAESQAPESDGEHQAQEGNVESQVPESNGEYQAPEAPYTEPATTSQSQDNLYQGGQYEGAPYQGSQYQGNQYQGIPYQPAYAVAPGHKVINKHLFVWLAAFFLGGLGVDRFMRGQVGMGVAKILLGWLTLGIWPLVDWIIAMVKAYGEAFGNVEEIEFDATGAYVR